MAQPLADDTLAHTEAEVLAILRALTAGQKLELARNMNRLADRLALAGIARRQPSASPQEQGYALALQRLTPAWSDHGAELLKQLVITPTPADPLAVALRVGTFCDAQGIPYVIVGSVAAIVHGEYRTLRNINLVLELPRDKARTLTDRLREDFTFSADDITNALHRLPEAGNDLTQRASFCAYDTATGFQLSVCLASGLPFENAQFQRAGLVDIPGGGSLRIMSAEDTVLATLAWYTRTRSDCQWRDVQAIIRVRDGALDLAYLRQWAAQLELADLLEQALWGQPTLMVGWLSQ